MVFFCKQVFQRYIFEFIGAPLRREISKRASIYDGSYWMNGQWFLQFESLYGCNTISAKTYLYVGRSQDERHLKQSYVWVTVKWQELKIENSHLGTGVANLPKVFAEWNSLLKRRQNHSKTSEPPQTNIWGKVPAATWLYSVSPTTLLLKCLLLLPPSNVSPTWHSHDD